VHGVSLWDALILAACLDAGVDVLYSEDVPAVETFETVRVINPFK
jgi:predicted nucleic acid-binding protein